MAQVFSLPISIPSILILFMGGLSVMIIPIGDEPTVWWNPITMILWFLGIVWLVVTLLYLKQRVYVYVEDCNLSVDSENNHCFKITVLVSSSHPDILRKIELIMQPLFVCHDFSATTPRSITSVPERFDVMYNLSSNIIDEAMEKQNNKYDIILWLQAVTSKSQWITDGFRMPIQTNPDGIRIGVGMSSRIGSLGKSTRRKKGEEHLGVTQEQFTKMQNKASRKNS